MYTNVCACVGVGLVVGVYEPMMMIVHANETNTQISVQLLFQKEGEKIIRSCTSLINVRAYEQKG